MRFNRIMQPGITLSASGVCRSVRDVHANFTCHGQICAHKLRLFQRFEIFHGLILTKLSHALRWASLEISTKASFNQRSTDSARVLINSVLLSEQYCSPFRLSIAHALIHTMHGYILYVCTMSNDARVTHMLKKPYSISFIELKYNCVHLNKIQLLLRHSLFAE